MLILNLFLVFLLCSCSFEDATARVLCPGVYDGHLQGIATDKTKAIYWSFTVALVKTDEQGQLITKVSVPDHHGDLTYHDGKIYVAVNLGKFNREDGADSWVYVYNVDGLSLIRKKPVPELIHGAGGIAYHNNHFFLVGGLPDKYDQNFVYEYDKDFNFVQKHIILSGHTDKGIQTVTCLNGIWLFGCYGKPKQLLKTDNAFRLFGRFDFDCAKGVEALTDGMVLVGRSVKNDIGHRGEALPAKPDSLEGLKLLTESDSLSEQTLMPKDDHPNP